MSERDHFYLGFKFALWLTGSRDAKTIREKLKSLAQGELSLLESPTEMHFKIQRMIELYEQDKGEPATDREKKLVRDRLESMIPANRSEQDGRNRDLAAFILKKMDEEFKVR